MDSNEIPVTGENAEKEHQKIEEITLKFGKGCVGDTFKGKDGKEYTSILIPNSDPDDHRPWATFVAKSNAVHEDKFGKGMWIKLPADGHTTIQRNECIGEDSEGKKIWEKSKTKVANRDLKGMVEFYKTRSKDSIRQKLDEKKADVSASKSEPSLKPDKAKAAGVAL